MASKIFDKIGLKINGKDLDFADRSKAQEQLGMELMLTVISKIHLAEDEVYTLISDVLGYTKEKVQDMSIEEIVSTLKEIFTNPAIMSFFK